MAGCYQEHPDGEFATCHLSPCGSHQALPWLGQPTAIGRSSSKVSPGFWKTSIFPEANVCPVYTRRTEASSLTGTATWEGHECVPARGFKSLLPKQCLLTRQRQCPQKLFGSGGGFSAPPAPRAWSELGCLLPAHPYLPDIPHLWRRSYGQHWGTRALPLHHILGAELPQKPHTRPLSPARARVTITMGQLPGFPSFQKPPYSACRPHPGPPPARGDSPQVTHAWGQMSFLTNEVYQNPSGKPSSLLKAARGYQILKVEVVLPLWKPQHNN